MGHQLEDVACYPVLDYATRLLFQLGRQRQNTPSKPPCHSIIYPMQTELDSSRDEEDLRGLCQAAACR